MPKKKGRPHPIKTSQPELPKWNGTLIKGLRVDQGMTVAELAEKAGISGGQLSDIENGKGGFSTKSLYNLARALGVSRRSLLPRDPWDRTGDDFWPVWDSANPHQRTQIATIARTVVAPDKKGG